MQCGAATPGWRTRWAAAPAPLLAQYPHDITRAKSLLATAGYAHGLRLEMKLSMDETTRLVAEILQQQLAAASIQLTLRSSEFGTFYSDVTAGRFQMYALRWIGSNEDPDIFRYAYASSDFPPKGGNRGHYSNTTLDALLTSASATTDENVRRGEYVRGQQILAEQVPTVPLWSPDNEVVHTTRVKGIVPRVDGSFGFLRDAWIEPQ